MEKLKSLSEVFCSLHPSFPIQGISLDKPEAPSLLCFSCIAEQKNVSVKTFPQFLENIAGTFAKNRQIASMDGKPQEEADILLKKAEKLELLIQHIEEQKRMIEEDFGSLTKQLLEILHNKKKEFLEEFDQQLAKLNKTFAEFELQLDHLYPANDEELASLFPTQENLEKKFKGISRLDELMSFVKDLHQYHLEEQKRDDLNEKLNWKKYRIKRLGQELLKDLKPVYNREKFDQLRFIQDFELQVFKCFKMKEHIHSPIQDSTEVEGNPFGSTMVTVEEYHTIRSWLPSYHESLSPKLIYHSLRDGFNGVAFQKLCDEKTVTVTLVKVLFDGATEPCVVGGYVNKGWFKDHPGFIFNLTSKVKCGLNFYGHLSKKFYSSEKSGFGWSHDLRIVFSGKGSVTPYHYSETKSLVNVCSYEGKDLIYFQTLELEVYELQ